MGLTRRSPTGLFGRFPSRENDGVESVSELLYGLKNFCDVNAKRVQLLVLGHVSAFFGHIDSNRWQEFVLNVVEIDPACR